MIAAAVRRAVALVLALAVLILGSVAQAQYRHRVVLIDQPSTDEASTEVLARVRGELTAAGFEVVLLPATVEGDPAVVSETTGRELHPAAVIFVIEKPAEGSEPRRIEVWLSDRLSRRTFVQSLPVEADEAGRGYRRLAIQVVELLKARLAELMVTNMPELPPQPPKPPPEPDEPPPPPPPEPPGVGGRIAGGVVLFQGFEGLGSTFAARVRAGATFPVGSIRGAPFVLDIGGTIAGLGSKATLSTAGGEAEVGQALGTLDVALRFDRGGTLQPVLLVSGGAYAVTIDGTTDEARIGREEETWSMFTAVGAGAWIQPTPAFAIELEGQVGRAWAKTVVRIDGEEAAETGSPLVLLSVAAVGVF
jgi:hypothetical protein